MEQMRSLVSMLLSFSNSNNVSRTNQPVISNPSLDNAINVDDDVNANANYSHRNEPKFKLELALGRLQSYYAKAAKFSGDFEDDLEDAFTEFNTACKGQLAPDEAKSELLRLAIRGRALTTTNQFLQLLYHGQ